MQRLGMEDGVPIEHGMVTKAIERAQKQVEAQNFGTRKHLLEYDDVMNKQRENIYALRRELLEGKIRVQGDEDGDEIEHVDTRAYLLTLAEDILDDAIEAYAGKEMEPEEWDLDALKMDMSRVFGLDAGDYARPRFQRQERRRNPRRALGAHRQEIRREGNSCVGAEAMRQVERFVMLETVDRQWKDHLYSLDHLKEGIGLRGYGQKDPLVEYKKESFELFQDMKRRVDEDMVNRLWIGQFTVVGDDAPPRPPRRAAAPIMLNEPKAEPVGVRSAPRASAAPTGFPPRPRVFPLALRLRRASAATMRPCRPCGATSRKWAATIRARAAAERNTRSAMEQRPDGERETPRQSFSWARSTSSPTSRLP